MKQGIYSPSIAIRERNPPETKILLYSPLVFTRGFSRQGMTFYVYPSSNLSRQFQSCIDFVEDIRFNKYIIMTAPAADYFTLLNQAFLDIGLKESEVKRILRDYAIHTEGAVIDGVLAALTPAEAETLKTRLETSEKNVASYTKCIQDACANSVNKNKINLDNIANQARFNAAVKYTKEMKNQLNQKQIDQLKNKINQYLENHNANTKLQMIGKGAYTSHG